MNRSEQRRFVRELCSNVLKSVLLKSDRWPEGWDGHELRALLEEAFRDANVGLCTSTPRCAHLRRRRSFRNECIVRNLP